MSGPESSEEWPTGRLLATAARLVEHAWDQRLRDLGLSHAAVVVLHLLSRQDEVPQAQLATAARVQPQTMSRTLDRMERDRLVLRAASAADRRKRIVHITPEGRAALQAAFDAEQQAVPQVDEPERLRQALFQILAALPREPAPRDG